MAKQSTPRPTPPDTELDPALTKIFGYLIGVMDEFSKKMDAGFARIDERFVQMDERFDRLEIRMDKLESRMEALELRMDKLENRMDKIELRTERLESYTDRLDKRIIILEERMLHFERNQKTNQDRVESLFQAVLQNQDTMSDQLRVRVEQLEARIKSCEDLLQHA
jgi:chromosome segregation ATPase